MVADVLDIERLLAAAVQCFARGDIADVGLALGRRAQRAWLGQHRLQELQRNDLHPVINHRIDPRHAHVLQHGQVLDIGIAKGHPEPPALQLGNELREAFQLLVVHHVHVLRAHGLKVERHLLAHRRRLDKRAVLPMPRWRSHLADVDLGVEVGGKGLPMIAAIAIQNIQLPNGLQLVLLQPHREHAGHARIEPAAQQRHQTRLLEPLLIGPLPVVLELGHILGLIVGGIHVMHARRQARVHNGQVLIGQRQIDHQLGPDLADQGGQRRHILGIDGISPHRLTDPRLDRLRDRLALADRAAGQMDLGEDAGVHRHLVDAHRAHPARADHQNLAHRRYSMFAAHSGLAHIGRACDISTSKTGRRSECEGLVPRAPSTLSTRHCPAALRNAAPPEAISCGFAAWHMAACRAQGGQERGARGVCPSHLTPSYFTNKLANSTCVDHRNCPTGRSSAKRHPAATKVAASRAQLAGLHET